MIRHTARGIPPSVNRPGWDGDRGPDSISRMVNRSLRGYGFFPGVWGTN